MFKTLEYFRVYYEDKWYYAHRLSKNTTIVCESSAILISITSVIQDNTNLSLVLLFIPLKFSKAISEDEGNNCV